MRRLIGSLTLALASASCSEPKHAMVGEYQLASAFTTRQVVVPCPPGTGPYCYTQGDGSSASVSGTLRIEDVNEDGDITATATLTMVDANHIFAAPATLESSFVEGHLSAIKSTAVEMSLASVGTAARADAIRLKGTFSGSMISGTMEWGDFRTFYAGTFTATRK
jgi:hypothetical protein